MSELRNCAQCGALFSPINCRATCSDACAVLRRREQHKRNMATHAVTEREMQQAREGRIALKPLDAVVRERRRAARVVGFWR